MAAPSPTKLDANQVLKASFDEVNGRLRTDAVISGDVVISDINISQVDDSIRIGDGINLVTSTVDGPKVGLDVNVLNDITLEISAADGDNIAISDGTNTLAIEPNGSINVNVTGTSPDNLTVSYNEVNSVATGVLTTINSYTALSDVRLKEVSVSGENIATYELLVNSNIVEKRRTYFGSNLNTDFQLENYNLLMGDLVLIRVIHDRPTTASFNASIKILG